jgi:serine/threonine protein kinase
MTAMKLAWSPGMPLGGPANYRSPEINLKFGVPSSYQLDYDKSDIYALGIILGNMMCGRPLIYEPKTWTLSHQITQVYAEVYPIATQLLNDMIEKDSKKRSSCYDIHERTIGLAYYFIPLSATTQSRIIIEFNFIPIVVAPSIKT